MPLDQPTTAFLDMLRSSGGKPLYELPLAEARAAMAMGSQLGAPHRPTVGRIVDRAIDVPGGTIGLRIYTPAAASDGAALPAVLQYHGGGFVLGNLDTHESIARYYCAHAGAVVISVDYRLAPEHRFPTQVEDVIRGADVGQRSTRASLAWIRREWRWQATAPAETWRP